MITISSGCFFCSRALLTTDRKNTSLGGRARRVFNRIGSEILQIKRELSVDPAIILDPSLVKQQQVILKI